MLRTLLLAAALAGCAVLPAKDPAIARGLDGVQTELAALSTRFDLAPGGTVPLDAETQARFDRILADLQLSLWRAQGRAEGASGIAQRPAQISAEMIGRCREAVVGLYRLMQAGPLDRTSFDDSLTVKTCLIAADTEQRMR